MGVKFFFTEKTGNNYKNWKVNLESKSKVSNKDTVMTNLGVFLKNNHLIYKSENIFRNGASSQFNNKGGYIDRKCKLDNTGNCKLTEKITINSHSVTELHAVFKIEEPKEEFPF
jgi:hypothetical protein